MRRQPPWFKHYLGNDFCRWVDWEKYPRATLGTDIYGYYGATLYRGSGDWENVVKATTFADNINKLFTTSADTLLLGVGNIIKRTTDGLVFNDVLTASANSSFGLQNIAEGPAGTLYVATYGTKIPSNGFVYRSTDDGQTWTQILDLVTDMGYPAAGVHIHCIYYDPHTGKMWLSVGDNPNSSILRYDETVHSPHWDILSHQTINPQTYPGYPTYLRHQPISMWADEDIVYFGADSSPFGIQGWDKRWECLTLPIDCLDYDITDYALGISFCETVDYCYHGIRLSTGTGFAPLFKYDKSIKEWEMVWYGYIDAQAATINGVDSIMVLPNGNNLMVYYFNGFRVGIFND